MRDVLGKIIKAEFGTPSDYPVLIGLELTFRLEDGGGVGCGNKYTANTRLPNFGVAIASIAKHIQQILADAKVEYVSQLVGKPVVVTLDGQLFRDFRILTEVL